jgi:hypothetical protein
MSLAMATAPLPYQSQPTLVIRPWRMRILTGCALTILAAGVMGLLGLVSVDAGLRGAGVARLAVGVLFLVFAAGLILWALLPLHLMLASLRVTSEQVIETRIGRSKRFEIDQIADAVLDDPEHEIVLIMRNGYQATLGLLDYCHPDDRRRFLDHLAGVIEQRDDSGSGAANR